MFEEVAKPDKTEVDIEEATVNLFEPDVVTGEQGGDKDAVCVPADASVARDEAGLEVPWVRDGLEVLRERTR